VSSRRRLAVAVALLGLAAAALPGLARAADPLHACGRPGLRCGEIEVPLDHSGATPGTISLLVAEQVADGFSRGVVLLVQGGPGGASTALLALPVWQEVFPGYTLVAYDDRGTGANPLACPGVERGTTVWDAAAVEACGEEIGPSRAFYTTRDHVEDMESVRRALGLGRIGIYGVSYGAKQAVAYALAHPDGVEWLLLDSVLPPEGPDPFAADVLRAVPDVLASVCSGGGCAGLGDPASGLARVANALAAKPVRVQHVPRFGTVPLDGESVLGLLYDSDFNQLVAPELPAAVAAGRAGWLQPLARLVALDHTSRQLGLKGVGVPLYLATTCGDGLFPWAPGTPIAERQAAIEAALGALAPGALGAFGDWAALSFGTASTCRAWPAPSGHAPLAAGPLPDVPVLVLAGDRDVRTPLAGSVEVASRFRQGRVLVAPGLPHGVLAASACAASAVRSWLAGSPPAAACPRLPLPSAPIGPFVRSLSSLAPLAAVAGLRGRTLAGVARTIEQAAADRLALPPPSRAELGSVSGLAGGLLSGDLVRSNRIGGVAYRLRAFSEIPGLTLTGTLRYKPSSTDTELGLLTPEPGSLQADVQVAGAGAAHGTLRLRGDRISGVLAGKRVAARLPGGAPG
jgi:pimeloyl-ACP methyl ester carboxylesterase